MKKQDYDILDDILIKVNEWLRFAESKNAALLALITGMTFAFLNYGKSINILDSEFGSLYFYNFITFMVLALCTVLMSFLPQTKLLWLWEEKRKSTSPNICFYSDLAGHDPRKLVRDIYPTAMDTKNNLQNIMICIAEQIVTNSKIAKRKYNYFRVALWSVLSGIFTPLVSVSLYIFLDPHWSGEIKT